jgi:hypothetical protein
MRGPQIGNGLAVTNCCPASVDLPFKPFVVGDEMVDGFGRQFVGLAARSQGELVEFSLLFLASDEAPIGGVSRDGIPGSFNDLGFVWCGRHFLARRLELSASGFAYTDDGRPAAAIIRRSRTWVIPLHR